VRNLGGCGGGILNYGGNPTITNCIFDTNANTHPDGQGGAIYNVGRADILNCTFYQNGWRLLSSGPEPRFRPYITQGGAIFDSMFAFGSTISNCIFSKNAAKIDGGAIFSNIGLAPRRTTLTNCLFHENIRWWPGDGDPESSHFYGTLNSNSAGNLYDIDPLLVDPAGGDFHLSYDSPCIDAGYALTFGYLPCPWPFGMPSTDFEGDKRIVDSDGDGVPAVDIGVDEVIPNLPDLGAFLQALADAGEIEQEVAELLLAHVNDAVTALAQDDLNEVRRILHDLIADTRALLGDTETEQAIEMRTEAVIEEI